jgi:hypothetical protein
VDLLHDERGRNEDEAHDRELTFRVEAIACPGEAQTWDYPGSGPSLDDVRVSLDEITAKTDAAFTVAL